MKKLVAFLLCLIMILSLFSCMSNENQNDLSSNENTSLSDVNDDSTDDDNTTLQLSKAETAMKMYEAVLENEIKVYEIDTQEYNYLADCRTPYESILLRDCGNLRYAHTDIDGDSTEEVIRSC